MTDHLALPYRNVKKAFAHVHGDRSWALRDAFAHVGLALEGTLHRGLDDALNIARLVRNSEALKAIMHD